MTPPLTRFLKDELTKPAEDSKKWKMAMIGLKGIVGFFVVGALLIYFVPSIATQAATLVQFALAAWGGIVALYLGAQGSVEYRTVAALQTSHDTREEHITTEAKVVDEDEGGPVRKPWGLQGETQG